MGIWKMKEFTDLIQKVITDMSNDGRLEKMVTASVEKMVSGAITSALESYSGFGRELNEQVKDALHFDVKLLGLAGYNETVMQIVKAKLSSAVNIQGAEKISEQIDGILSDVPAEIKLSELVEEFKQHCNDYPGVDCGDKVSCEVEVRNGYGTVTLMPHEKQRGIRKSITLQYDPEKNNVYGFSIGSEDYSKKIFANCRYGFQKLLFGLYACRAKLIIDEDQVDEYFHDEDND